MTAVRTAAATMKRLENQANRAADDPVRLAIAVRIVRAALARNRLTIADLTTHPAANGGCVR